MKQHIVKAAAEARISDIGIVKAEVFQDLGKFLSQMPSPPLAEPDIEKRINPFLLMPEAKSIIVCLSSYYTGKIPGNLSKYARGIDYHLVMKEQMHKIVLMLNRQGYQAICFCDNGPLDDRYLAYRAGLGFFGNNGFLIHERYGTYTFIGYLLTDCPLESDVPQDKSCMDCGKCYAACPGGALGRDKFCAERCISYLTQKKGQLTEEEKKLIKKGGSIWGCDICQDVCPHNQYAQKTNIYSFAENLIHDLDLPEQMSGRMFARMYGDRAFSWRGKGVLARNFEILHEKQADEKENL